MIFEGAEKKFECTSYSINLRTLGKVFFQKLVQKSNATILQKLSTSHCDSYLLSESSLFVWDHRILMITCGNTTLKHSVLLLIEKLGRNNIDSLIFQRKNEHFSELQITDFEQDVKDINKFLKGHILKFGLDNDHHNLIFSLDKDLPEASNDYTYEIFSYDISKQASLFLTQLNLNVADVRSFFKIDHILDGFEISDFNFRPCGYSLNALKNEEYCTIHVTPQESFSYVSFETNMSHNMNFIINHFIEILSPESLDIISFNIRDDINQVNNYEIKSHSKSKLRCGYDVEFQHLYKRKI
jgi:S-adenosylmethionine decarboxylase